MGRTGNFAHRQLPDPVSVATILKLMATGLAVVAVPAPSWALVVQVGSSRYDVTTVTGSLDSLRPTLQAQEWYANPNLALDFAQVAFAAGSPFNAGSAANFNGRYSPYFLWQEIDNKPLFNSVTIISACWEFKPTEVSLLPNCSAAVGVNTPSSFTFATATRLEDVPAPLPLLGAGAALAWSRRLRRRIRQRRGTPAGSSRP